MHKLLVNRLLKPAQEKVYRPAMTIAVDMECKETKTNKQTNKESELVALVALVLCVACRFNHVPINFLLVILIG